MVPKTRLGRGQNSTSDSTVGNDRAQTVQDFAVGVSVFLLAVAFVFAFVPSLFTPFSPSVDPGADQQATRVAAAMVDDLSQPDRPNWLRLSAVDAEFTKSQSDLQNDYDLPRVSQINVTLMPMNQTKAQADGPVLEAGRPYSGQPAASTVRVVVVAAGGTSPSPPRVTRCNPRYDGYPSGDGDPGDGDDVNDYERGEACRLVIRIW
jgi:hypothetical protein